MRIIDITPAHHPWLLDLNQANLPAVSGLTLDSLDRLLGQCAHARLAVGADEQPAGALLALRPGQDYGSTNYRWFEAQGGDFLYIDRVMVSAAARSQGIGAALYQDLAAFGRAAGVPQLCCEVNEEPPNPRSQAFHERLGFAGVHSRINETDGKRVLMMVWWL